MKQITALKENSWMLSEHKPTSDRSVWLLA
jgi:hypothetical protein